MINNLRLKLNSFISINTLLINLLTLLTAIVFTFVIVALYLNASFFGVITTLVQELPNSIRITISSVALSLLLTILLGIPSAYVISRVKGRLIKVFDVITMIPIALPPTILGLALLMTYGRQGILFKQSFLPDWQIPFSFLALIFVQVYIMLPIFIQLVKNAFKSVDKDIIEAAILFGADHLDMLIHIYLPICAKSIFTAALVCMLRASGEFGATIMFAGNVKSKTQTISTAIYSLSQSNIQDAISLAVLFITFLIVPMFGIIAFKKSQRS